MTTSEIVAWTITILGSGGLGAWVVIPYAKQKARADVAHKEAEVANLDETRMARRVETLTAIITELDDTLTGYRTRLTDQQKQLDDAIAQSSTVSEALRQARCDLVEHSRTIDRLRTRIRQLEKALTDHSIPIPKDRRKDAE